MLKTIGVGLLFVLGFLLVLALGGAALLLLAYGLALLVSWLAHIELFQAMLLSLAAIFVAGVFMERILSTITSSPPYGLGNEDDEEDDDGEEDEEDHGNVEFINVAIPRWRQPMKQIDFSEVKPDDRCPCGSGRKYKNCHGIRQAKTASGKG